jgi:hypothetical protein
MLKNIVLLFWGFSVKLQFDVYVVFSTAHIYFFKKLKTIRQAISVIFVAGKNLLVKERRIPTNLSTGSPCLRNDDDVFLNTLVNRELF